MLSTFKRFKHQQYLSQLPKLCQSADDVQVLYDPASFRTTLVEKILSAQQRICLVALYLEQDDGGQDVIDALYQAKNANPELQIMVLVDWHRAQRGRIGAAAQNTNADWYCRMAAQHPSLSIPIYGVPVNTREALGVLHLKGFIIDDTVIYSGASLNNVYLHRYDKYRYDRYYILRNSRMAETMIDYIQQHFLLAAAVQRLDHCDRPKNLEIRNETRRLRSQLRRSAYRYQEEHAQQQLAVVPLVGLGKGNLLNKTIDHLMCSTEQMLTICTPYFNLPASLAKNIVYLLRQNIKVEIIIGDKTANDFYIPENEPFKIIGALPYLYEINLRRFVARLQSFVNKGLLNIRLWKDQDNSFHLKGLWVDDNWQLITGNNLNPRAWRLDLENAILIHDPLQQLTEQRKQELNHIRTHTQRVSHFQEIEDLPSYPIKVRKLIRRLRRIRIDRLINRIL